MDMLQNQQELAGYFADCLIDQKFPSGLDEAGFETIRTDLIDRINREITTVIFDNLTEEQLEEMENLLDEDDGRRAALFLRETIPDLRRLVLERLVLLREEIN